MSPEPDAALDTATKGPSTPQPPASPPGPSAAAAEAKVPIRAYLRNARHAVPLAGLLAARPELRGTQQTPSDWAVEEDYLSQSPPSERKPKDGE